MGAKSKSKFKQVDAHRYMHYTLTLRSPLILGARSGDPNSAGTMMFIPGSTIRGAIAAALRPGNDEKSQEEFRRLVLSGSVRYLHAYPELAGARSMPTPLSWRGTKHNAHQVYDLAGAHEQAWPEAALVGPAGSFVSTTAQSGHFEIATPTQGARFHNQRDRIKGRPGANESGESRGAIFGYEFLEPGQVFHGALQLVPGTNNVKSLRNALEQQPLLLGRSRRGGYGGDIVVAVEKDYGENEYVHLADRLKNEAELPRGCEFRLLLTSAYIGRNPITGQIDPTALVSEITTRLQGTVEVLSRTWNAEPIAAFNRKWRLPVPDATALAAGSVLVLRAKDNIPMASLTALEHAGLGERRIEGYGRIAWLAHHKEVRQLRTVAPKAESSTLRQPAPPLPKHTDKAHQAVLDGIAGRILLDAAKAELERIATDLVSGAPNAPTNSLIGRIRTMLRSAVSEDTATVALDAVAKACARKKGSADMTGFRDSALTQLERCHLGEPTLLDWLKALSAPPSPPWQRLLTACNPSQDALARLKDQYFITTPIDAQSILNKNANALSVYLIDVVLADLARANRSGEGGET